MRYSVSKEVEFDAGHRVPEHKSKCRNPHGHRYRVRATVSGQLREHGSDTGMVFDFGDLKTILVEQVHDRFDHGFIVYERDTAMKAALDVGGTADVTPWNVIVVGYVPTAENLAADIWRTLARALAGYAGLTLDSVEVWETPTGLATVTRG